MIRSSLVLLSLIGLIIAGPKSQALDNFEIEAGGFWSLVDTVDLLDPRQDVSTISVETGLVIEPMPFISLRAAYRYHLTDYTDSLTCHDRREVTDGFLFGGGIRW